MGASYKVATPRKDVCEGRSFNTRTSSPSVWKVTVGNAPEDYGDPEKLFSRTCFTRALRDHAARAAATVGQEPPKAPRR